MRQRLIAMAGSAAVPCVGEVRGLGAMVGVEFVRDTVTKAPDPEAVRGLTLATADQGVAGVPQSEADRAISDPTWRRRDAVLSGITLVLVGLVMAYFSNLFF